MNTKKISKIWNCSDKEFQSILDESYSYTEILEKFGISSKGQNSVTIKKRIKDGKFDTSKFDHNRSNFRKIRYKSLDIDQVMVINSPHSRNVVKRLVIKFNLLEYKCHECGLGDCWNNKKISLVLDHINGISNDHRLENLRILCPNCHSQTDNFGSKNRSYKIIKDDAKNIPNDIKLVKKTINKICDYCKKDFQTKQNKKYCSTECDGLQKRKVIRPTKEELELLLWSKPTTHIASIYNVSDKAVAKWAKTYGIEKPERGYWTKKKFKK